MGFTHNFWIHPQVDMSIQRVTSLRMLMSNTGYEHSEGRNSLDCTAAWIQELQGSPFILDNFPRILESSPQVDMNIH